jgi:RND superfamily putative drug exporter
MAVHVNAPLVTDQPPATPRGWLVNLTRWVIAHRRVVMAAWLVLLVAGGATVGRTTKRLTADFSLPGQPGYQTEQQILRDYGNGDQQQPLVLLFSGTTPGAARAAFARVGHLVDHVRVISSPRWTAAGGRTSYALAFLPPPGTAAFSDPYVPRLEAALHEVAPPRATSGLTGYNVLDSGEGSGKGPGVLVETMLGGLGALAVLAFVFASLLALMPLVIAGVSILASFLALLGLTYLTSISFIVQFLVALIGLGVAVDYSLLIVTRWREERDRGRDNRDAVVTAMATAGHAVVFSGVTVAIGLISLVVLPVPFLRSMGYGGALIPLVSVLAATTLLPALLVSVGPRVDWPRIRHEASASRAWTRWAGAVVRRRAAGAALALAVLALLLVPFTSLKVGLSSTKSLARSGPAYAALHALTDHGVSPGVVTPMEVLAGGDSAPALAARLQRVPGVSSAVAQPPAENRAGTSIVVVIPDQETVNSASLGPVRAVGAAVSSYPAGIGVAGTGPAQIDFVKGVYDHLPEVLVVVVVLSFLLLARAFRSLLLPLKAVVLNLISLGATFGAMTAFWQWGWGSRLVFGIAPTGAITFWVPILTFAFLFGLSMDYEVFILSRMREEYDRTGSTTEAVVTGIGRTGRLVTSAALILFLAFLSLASGPQTDVKVMATGLGFGILLDATVIRSLLVPALVSMFGRINWVLPRRLALLLRVKTAPPVTAPAGAGRLRP